MYNVGPKALRSIVAAKAKVYLSGYHTLKEAIDSYNLAGFKQADNVNVGICRG